MQQTPRPAGLEERRLQIAAGSSLGCGSFAVVYRATWCGIQCALKVLRPQYTHSELAECQANLLRREGQALMRHPHRFLARCYAVVELPPDFAGLPPGYRRPVPALVLELMEDGSLQRLLRRQQLAPWRPLYDTATALELATQIAQALAHLHGLDPPVIHRDVKPDNVLLSKHKHPHPQQQHQRQTATVEDDGGFSGCGAAPWVAKLVDLGLHTTPQGARCQRQPLFRASASFEARTVAALSAGGATGPGAPHSVDRSTASTNSAANGVGGQPAANAAGGDGGGGGRHRGGSPAAPVSDPLSLFFAEMRVEGEPVMVPVNPRSPGFRNLDEPLLPLPVPPPPVWTAAAAHLPLGRVPQSEPLPGAEPEPELAADDDPKASGVLKLDGGMVPAAPVAPPPSLLSPYKLPLQPSPLPQPRSPLPRQLLPRISDTGTRQERGCAYGLPPPLSSSLIDDRPMLLDIVPPAHLCDVLAPMYPLPPPHRRPSSLADAGAAEDDGGCGCSGGGGGADGNGDCGSCRSGSEAAFELGLCSIMASGRSLHFLYPASELAGAAARPPAAGHAGDPLLASAVAFCATTPIINPAAAAAALGPIMPADGRATHPGTNLAQGPRYRVLQQRPQPHLHQHAHQRQLRDQPAPWQQRIQPPEQQQRQQRQQQQGYGGAGTPNAVCVVVRVSCPPDCSPACVQEVPFLKPSSGLSYVDDDDMRRPYTPLRLTPPPRAPVSAGIPLPPPSALLSYEKVFRLTGETGSCMTMAPEVYLALPYNEKADVFSFGVLMYELFSRSLLMSSYIGVKRPEFPRVLTRCEHYTEEVARGFRPARVGSIPDPVWALINECWDQDPLVRPHMKDVVLRLKEMAAASRPGAPAAVKSDLQSAASGGRRRGDDGGAVACFGGGIGRGAAAAAAAAAGSGGAVLVEGEDAAATDGCSGRSGGGGCLPPGCRPGCVVS